MIDISDYLPSEYGGASRMEPLGASIDDKRKVGTHVVFGIISIHCNEMFLLTYLLYTKYQI